MSRVTLIEGTGGVGTTGSVLQCNPAPIPFGSVQSNQAAVITVTLKAIGDTTVHVSGVTFGDGVYTSPTAFPITINPNQTASVQIQFLPTDLLAHNTNATFTSDANNAPLVVPVTGQGIGTASLSVSPSAHDYGSQKVTVASGEFLFTVTNVGNANITVSAIGFNGTFSAGPTQPGLPITLTPTQSFQFGVLFTPVAAGFVVTTNAAALTNTSAVNPLNVQCSGTGYLITPAFSILGVSTQVLFGFFLSGVSAMLQANPSNLSCEESGFWKRQMAFNGPLEESHLVRCGIRHDDKGVATLTYQAKSKRNKAAPVTQNVTLGTASADGLITTAFSDQAMVSAEVIEIQFSFAANAGPISVTGIYPEVEEGGDYVEGT